jgi:putative colanic acid biosynthesis acetyltransferase WcaF
MPIDIVQHLRNQNYSSGTQLRRVLWGLCRPFFRLSPSPLYAWRNFLLRLQGARVGRGVRVHPSVRVMFPWNLSLAEHVVIGHEAKLYALAPIVIETNVLVSQGVHLCAGSHDYRRPNFPIAHAPIRIGAGTWLAAEAFIGPGVTVAAGAVVGARAVVMHDIDAAAVVVGNPARTVKTLPSSQ